MVVRCFPQRHRHGRSWCPQPPIRHGQPWMVYILTLNIVSSKNIGSFFNNWVEFLVRIYMKNLSFFPLHFQGAWGGDSDTVMGDHSVHSVANGGDARNGAWEKI